jgi:hypothetical protein
MKVALSNELYDDNFVSSYGVCGGIEPERKYWGMASDAISTKYNVRTACHGIEYDE